jgi:hypothetical protein
MAYVFNNTGSGVSGAFSQESGAVIGGSTGNGRRRRVP